MILLSTVIYIYWSSKLQTFNVDLIHVMGIQNEENPSRGYEEKAGSITCDSISISILCNSYVLPTWHCPKANANEGLAIQLFSWGCSRCAFLFIFNSKNLNYEQSEDRLQPCASFQFFYKPEDWLLQVSLPEMDFLGYIVALFQMSSKTFQTAGMTFSSTLQEELFSGPCVLFCLQCSLLNVQELIGSERRNTIKN